MTPVGAAAEIATPEPASAVEAVVEPGPAETVTEQKRFVAIGRELGGRRGIIELDIAR
jgi:hypothetical protein